MKKNYLLIAVCALLTGIMSYGQAPPKFSLDFEGANPLSNLPAGVTNVNGTNTVRVKNTTDYPAISNAVQSDGSGGNELFLDFHGYLKMDLNTSNGFSIAFDYRRDSSVDYEWWLGFLTLIGNNGSNVLEQIQIQKAWASVFDFAGNQSPETGKNLESESKIVVTCNSSGDIKIYIDNILRLTVPNSTSNKNLHTWTNTSLLLSFKGGSFDGTIVTPEPDYSFNTRDTRAFVDNVKLYEREISALEISDIYYNNNSFNGSASYFIDFETGGVGLSNLPSGVTNVNSSNTVVAYNGSTPTSYPQIPNTEQADGSGGKELFIDFLGYLRFDNPTPSAGFSIAFDYKRTWDNTDWWLGFLTFIGHNGSNNTLEPMLIREWDGQLTFGSPNSDTEKPIGFDTEYKVVVTVNTVGDLKVYVDNVLKFTAKNSDSGKNLQNWTNAGLLLSFKGNSFDGTNVTPDSDFATRVEDVRAYVDNIAFFQGALSMFQVDQLFANGNNSLSVKERNLGTSRLSLYPNPVEDVLNFSSPDVKSVTIYSILGSKVMTTAITNSSADVSSLKSGVYFVNCFDADGKKTDGIKMIKL
jgi:Secretion system C-terminal sorting domain